MISKRVLINLMVVLIVSAALVTYGAVTLFGNPLAKRTKISTELADSAGLRNGFSASVNGVVVGRVSNVRLTKHGARVTVELDRGATVPSNVVARVVRASAVGEQRIEFTPTGAGSAAPLPDGAEVKAAPDATPPEVADVLGVATRLIDAIPTKDLNTIVHEGARSVRSQAENLRSIVRSLTIISDNFVAGDKDFRRLLAASPSVLDDFSAMAPEVRKALSNTRALTAILADDSGRFVDLLRDGSSFAQVADTVLLDNRTNLTCLIGDLQTLSAFTQGRVLRNLDRGLGLNGRFFGAIDTLAPQGHAADIGLGGHERNNQTWLRTRLLLPPAQPSASAYSPHRTPRPVKTGAGCANRYGSGANPVAAARTPASPAAAA
ncbi:MAG: putative virulence factor, Mce family protein, partial [Acidimicrobiales bacterium]|nr:putative virulence factor, Mce family protein [Acidimicrobiales bacterium]